MNIKLFFKSRVFLLASIYISVLTGMFDFTSAAITNVQKEELRKFLISREVHKDSAGSFNREFLMKMQQIRQDGNEWQVPYSIIKAATGLKLKFIFHKSFCLNDNKNFSPRADCDCQDYHYLDLPSGKGPQSLLSGNDLLQIIGGDQSLQCDYLKKNNLFPDVEKYKIDEHGALLGYLKNSIFAKLHISLLLITKLFELGQRNSEIVKFLSQTKSIQEGTDKFKLHLGEFERVVDLLTGELEAVRLRFEEQGQNVIKKFNRISGKAIQNLEELEEIVTRHHDVEQFAYDLFNKVDNGIVISSSSGSSSSSSSNFLVSSGLLSSYGKAQKGERKERVQDDGNTSSVEMEEGHNERAHTGEQTKIYRRFCKNILLNKSPWAYFGPCASIEASAIKKLIYILKLQQAIKQVYTLIIQDHLEQACFLLNLRLGLLFQGLLCCEDLHSMIHDCTEVFEIVEKAQTEQTLAELHQDMQQARSAQAQVEHDMARLQEIQEKEQKTRDGEIARVRREMQMQSEMALRQEREIREKETVQLKGDVERAERAAQSAQEKCIQAEKTLVGMQEEVGKSKQEIEKQRKLIKTLRKKALKAQQKAKQAKKTIAEVQAKAERTQEELDIFKKQAEQAVLQLDRRMEERLEEWMKALRFGPSQGMPGVGLVNGSSSYLTGSLQPPSIGYQQPPYIEYQPSPSCSSSSSSSFVPSSFSSMSSSSSASSSSSSFNGSDSLVSSEPLFSGETTLLGTQKKQDDDTESTGSDMSGISSLGSLAGSRSQIGDGAEDEQGDWDLMEGDQE